MAANPNALFGFPNLSDVSPPGLNYTGRTPVFLDNVGSWLPSAPLPNLQNRFFANKARSRNASPPDTQFAIDLTDTFPVLCVTIPRHNLTLNATITVTLWADLAMTQKVASQQVLVATQSAWGSLAFGDAAWFNGVITSELAQYFPQPATVIFTQPQYCRVVQVAINDPDNPAKYVELGRLFVTPGYQPSINIKYGAQIGPNDLTVEAVSLGSASFYDIRAKQRVVVAGIDYLPEQEAFSNFLTMQLRLGISGQFFFSMYPADPSKAALTSFVATLQKLDPLTAAAFGYQGVSFTIKEVTA